MGKGPHEVSEESSDTGNMQTSITRCGRRGRQQTGYFATVFMMGQVAHTSAEGAIVSIKGRHVQPKIERKVADCVQRTIKRHTASRQTLNSSTHSQVFLRAI